MQSRGTTEKPSGISVYISRESAPIALLPLISNFERLPPPSTHNRPSTNSDYSSFKTTLTTTYASNAPPKCPSKPSTGTSLISPSQSSNPQSSSSHPPQQARIPLQNPQHRRPRRPRCLGRMVRPLQGHRPQSRRVQHQIRRSQVLQDQRRPGARRCTGAWHSCHAYDSVL